MPNKLFGLQPIDFSSGRADHLEARRALIPGPLPTPIGYERFGNGSRSQAQNSAEDRAPGPASSQTVPEDPSTEAVDSPMQPTSSTNHEDETQDLRDSFPLLPLVQQMELSNIHLPPMSDEQLEQYWRPLGYGPTVPIEISRRKFDLGGRYPGQLFHPYACAAFRRALATSDPWAYHPMGPPSWAVRQRLEKELRMLEEYEERRRQQEEAQRRGLERRITEELLRREREEADLQRITAEYEQTKRRPDLPNDRYKRPEAEEARDHCINQHTEMLEERAEHVCTDAPCFDQACTIGMPRPTGCRYADFFHSATNTNPCIWGWGLMLRRFEEEIGFVAARTADLDEIAGWYRGQRRNDQRFQGPVLVTDPPNAPDRNKCYWVIAPPQWQGWSREGLARQ